MSGNADVFVMAEGCTPLVVSLPHVGTVLPPELASRMTGRALQVPDTDWHVNHLYAFAREAGAAWLEARLSRYVVDLNRPPDDASLYPGQASTGLCPSASFDGEPLYRAEPPDVTEVADRRARYWEPFHSALAELVAAAHARFGYAIVLDAHSIRSVVPRLFDGRLPDVNVGTFGGRSCDARLTDSVMHALGVQSRFSYVLDGRFKGGYITRAYGRPSQGVHALQIELAQAAYMDERTCAWDGARAQPLLGLLRGVVGAALEFRPG